MKSLSALDMKCDTERLTLNSMPPSYNDMTSTFPMRPISDIPDQDSYRGSVSSFPLYSDGSAPFTGYSAQHALPLLRIPEDPLMPGLSYTQDNSPWCSSSESTYSTHSDSSHIGRMGSRGRSGSLVTAPEWSAVPVSGAHWSSHGKCQVFQLEEAHVAATKTNVSFLQV
jgi:hypothetical protein